VLPPSALFTVDSFPLVAFFSGQGRKSFKTGHLQSLIDWVSTKCKTFLFYFCKNLKIDNFRITNSYHFRNTLLQHMSESFNALTIMRFNLEILSLGGGICQGRDFSIFIQQK
jgi:hypothetical protein